MNYNLIMNWRILMNFKKQWLEKYSGNTICTIQLLDVMSQEKRMFYGVRSTFLLF